ncbi:MAG: hypothetical protein A3G34_17535 [Candidatus Lindowbacteria bacterium RIFCSPLOWO2_12_FULL_62_27]|nr:MAG: hypothetical protein A3G34_17535 [Candidatus Lindowbacteria bacterium RIFCSPLOWO2_12_FULL_62_27]OGH56759.1 MAG: hypothetical protein A3I06_12840 [Candidatus Lindowbacteria bacterium RIFCSPLOWO2_02_FULL_62_12]
MKYIFASPAMKAVQSKIRQVAPTDSTVLVTGESGSGKEVAARLIHEQSGRRRSPFVAVNCAAFPGSLLEVELFGYEPGAFTGAQRRHRGLFEQAHRGTLFLDEVAELDLGLQAKFLRVIQERRFRRVGGEAEIEVDVRLIASTHQDLKKLVEDKKFREDLFYRISVFPIEIPPLRRRPEDVVSLAAHYIEHFNREMAKRVEGVTEETQQILLNYPWPGNVRELRNTIERVMILRSEGRIRPEEMPLEVITGVERLPTADPEIYIPRGTAKIQEEPPVLLQSPAPSAPAVLPGAPAAPAPPAGSAPPAPQVPASPTPAEDSGDGRDPLTRADLKHLDRQVARFEKDRIKAALKLAEGNQSEAARILGIRRDTLRFRMKRHRLMK